MTDGNLFSSRLPGTLAIAAGVAWLLIWLHGLRTHGGTEVNEMREFAGLTWMDSGKFLVLPFLLLIPSFLTLAGRVHRMRPSKPARVVGAITAAVLAIAAVGTALQFWTFEWGSYAETFESKGGIASAGGGIQAIASLVLAVAAAALGVIAWRAKAAPIWLTPLLFVGALASLFLTPANFVPGLTWLGFGLWLFLRHREVALPSSPTVRVTKTNGAPDI